MNTFPKPRRGASVLVAGGINVDVTGRGDGPFFPGSSTPGRVTVSTGGVARNIAENLARMGRSVRLVGAVGDDLLSRHVLEATEVSGVDVAHVYRLRGLSVGVYMSLLAGGDMETAIADTGATEQLSSDLLVRALTGALKAAGAAGETVAMVVLDTNLAAAALVAAVSWAAEQVPSLPVLVEPVSVAKCRRLRGVAHPIELITPNAGEARELLEGDGGREGLPPIRHWVVTRGGAGAAWWNCSGDEVSAASGVAASATSATSTPTTSTPTTSTSATPLWPLARLFPVTPVNGVNANGAGDAFVAALAHGYAAGRSIAECIGMGIEAGSYTVAAEDTVAPAEVVPAAWWDLR